jgi:capsular polysaccharide export protein
VTFNDVLERNRTVLDIAKLLGVHRYVIENGYLRPHWITFESDGVNAYSQMPRDPDFYRAYAKKLRDQAHTTSDQPFKSLVFDHVRNTVSHFASAIAMSPYFGFNQKYYGDSIVRQMVGYIKEYCLRKTYSEQHQAERVLAAHRGGDRKIFTVLMQKPGDGQLVVHSRFGGNRKFVREVIESFARSAPKNAFLILKQHPLDYGRERCPRLARKLIKKHGLQDRAIYLRKTSIDICMDYSAGMVTVNSTGGLQALQKGLAVICMGPSVYGFQGMTFQGSLDEFWSNGQPADPQVLAGYIGHLRDTSQLNGGFHSEEGRAILLPNFVQKLLADSPQTIGVTYRPQQAQDSGAAATGEAGAIGLAAE